MCLDSYNPALKFPLPSTRPSPITESGVFVRVEVPIEERLAAIGAIDDSELHAATADAAVEVIAELARDEEEDGFVDHVLILAPRLAPRIDDFFEETDELHRLATALHRYASVGAPKAMLHVMLERLLDGLSHRDAHKSELLQDALLTDIGEAG